MASQAEFLKESIRQLELEHGPDGQIVKGFKQQLARMEQNEKYPPVERYFVGMRGPADSGDTK